MKVLVLGAGVIGTTCAHYLSEDGHEVTVIDRQPGAALETSFANAGGVCPGFAGPWAAPGMPLKVLTWLFKSHAPLLLRPQFDTAQWRWLAQFVGNCTAERFAHNKARMQRIAHYSKQCLMDLRAATGIAYDEGAGGVLQIFRTEEELAGGRRAAAVLEQFDVAHRIVTAPEIRTLEPALSADLPLAGGLHLPTDETGDCHLFATRLAERMRELDDPTAHAEFLAIRAALAKRGTGRLDECDLFVTLEPCAMCAGAIAHTRIRRITYGAGDPKAGAVDHGVRLFDSPNTHHHPEVISGIGERRAGELLRAFFEGLRK